MAGGWQLVIRQVGGRVAILAVDVAREVPVEIVASAGDFRCRRSGDEAGTALVRPLEEKRSVVASKVPATSVKWIGRAVEDGGGSRVIEL